MAPHSAAGVGGAAQPAEEATEAPSAWERGTVVQLFGLVGRPEVNETAEMVVQFDEARGRYAAAGDQTHSHYAHQPPPVATDRIKRCLHCRQTASLPPHTLHVSGEGSLAPRKDSEKKDSAHETQVCAHCLVPAVPRRLHPSRNLGPCPSSRPSSWATCNEAIRKVLLMSAFISSSRA